MRFSKRYLLFVLLFSAALFLKFGDYAARYEELGSFRGAELKAATWNPLIASTANEGTLTVAIDSREYDSTDYPIYMDDNLNIMVPVTLLRDALSCSAHIYNGNELLVEKHSSQVKLTLDETIAEVDGKREAFVSPLTQKDGNYFVSIGELSAYLDYTYSWDVQENRAQATDSSGSAAIIPTRYDLRERGRASTVRNQGIFGTCWAFAALGALESSLLPEEEALYSPDHMTLANGFHITQDEGGEYTMGMAYLAAWKGPVNEEDDPYGDNVTDLSLSAVKHVQEMQVIAGKDYEKIKEAVFKYGGVQTSIYNGLRSSDADSPYYDSATCAYCYIGTEKPNHDVVIIGWDDSYPKENFTVDLEGDGAFLCQNSWGTGFGEDGVFYISYYDTNIGTHNVVYTRVEETDNYDNIYQSDLLGWVGQLGYGKEGMFGANVFTAEGAEELVAAGFYATAKDSQYELYVVRDFEDESSLSQRIPVASGKLGNAGYYTVDFDQAVSLEAGERFAVMLHIITPGSVHPMAVEYAADEVTADVVLDDGESYISSNGYSWTDAGTVEECNLCIKAFSNSKTE